MEKDLDDFKKQLMDEVKLKLAEVDAFKFKLAEMDAVKLQLAKIETVNTELVVRNHTLEESYKELKSNNMELEETVAKLVKAHRDIKVENDEEIKKIKDTNSIEVQKLNLQIQKLMVENGLCQKTNLYIDQILEMALNFFKKYRKVFLFVGWLSIAIYLYCGPQSFQWTPIVIFLFNKKETEIESITVSDIKEKILSIEMENLNNNTSANKN